MELDRELVVPTGVSCRRDVKEVERPEWDQYRNWYRAGARRCIIVARVSNVRSSDMADEGKKGQVVLVPCQREDMLPAGLALVAAI
jgi:hypothetical protein